MSKSEYFKNKKAKKEDDAKAETKPVVEVKTEVAESSTSGEKALTSVERAEEMAEIRKKRKEQLKGKSFDEIVDLYIDIKEDNDILRENNKMLNNQRNEANELADENANNAVVIKRKYEDLENSTSKKIEVAVAKVTVEKDAEIESLKKKNQDQEQALKSSDAENNRLTEALKEANDQVVNLAEQVKGVEALKLIMAEELSKSISLEFELAKKDHDSKVKDANGKYNSEVDAAKKACDKRCAAAKKERDFIVAEADKDFDERTSMIFKEELEKAISSYNEKAKKEKAKSNAENLNKMLMAVAGIAKEMADEANEEVESFKDEA